MEIWSGFLVGFLGSLHCIGMCGPIVLALPTPTISNLSFLTGRVLYNFGRVVTYGLLGLLFGLIGNRLQMFGLQQIVSIALGVIIILWVVIPAGLKNKLRNVSGFNIFTVKLKNAFMPLFKKRSNLSMFVIGILNGFLPCGFVYMAIAGAIAVSSASPFNGMLFMVFFGLGTVPAMLGTSLAGNLISFNIKKKFAKIVPVFAIILAVIFVLRGMNLGIPYISPKLGMHKQVSGESPKSR
jgi:sulfite exporter TauE/SafE